MNITSLLGITAAAVAVYGAALSTYVFVVQRSDRNPEINVTFQIGITALPSSEIRAVFSLEAANAGSVVTTLGSYGLQLPKAKYITRFSLLDGTTFPLVLHPGTKCAANFWVRPVLQKLADEGFTSRVDVIPFFTDHLSKHHRGKAFTIPVGEWLGNPDM